jgi:glycosyltransferase involved in cell wall biosynthesis
MRIVILMARYSPWSQQTAAALASLGHEIHLFDFRSGPDVSLANPHVSGIMEDYETFMANGLSLHLVDAPSIGRGRHIWAARPLRKLAHDVKADVVLTLYGGGLALTAYLSAFRPYCVYVVGSDVLKAGRIERRINRRTLTRAARVFANGEYLASKVMEQAPRAAATVLLLGVDPTMFEQATPPAGPVQLLCTRGFQPVYNNAAIIRALARIPPSQGEFRVVFTSGGELLDECRVLADRLLPAAIRDRVQFLGGVSYDHLRRELRRSHVIVSMSRSDGTATSTLEGMASGLYPVLSEIPQNRALIQPGESVGALVPLDDDAALAHTLADVICHAPARAKAARQNRRFIARLADARINRGILARELEAAAQTRTGIH